MKRYGAKVTFGELKVGEAFLTMKNGAVYQKFSEKGYRTSTGQLSSLRSTHPVYRVKETV